MNSCPFRRAEVKGAEPASPASKQPNNSCLLEEFDLEAVVPGEDTDAGALGERRHNFAREAEDGGLVRRTVADDKGAGVVGQGVEDATERDAEPVGVLRDELGVGVA
jgi:hypothetical protein